MGRPKKIKAGDLVRVEECVIGDANHVGMIGRFKECPTKIDREIGDVEGQDGGGVCCASKVSLVTDIYQQGDILVNEDGDERKILGVCGEVYFISNENDFDIASGDAYTKKELDDKGWELKSEKDEEVERAIKLLKKKGKLKDGKILEE